MTVRLREKDIGRLLAELRGAADLSQPELGGPVDLEPRTLRRWENEGVPRNVAQFVRMLERLGVAIDAPRTTHEAAPLVTQAAVAKAIEDVTAVLEQLLDPAAGQAPPKAAATSPRRRK